VQADGALPKDRISWALVAARERAGLIVSPRLVLLQDPA